MSVLPSPANTSAPQSKGYEANLDDLLLRFAVGPGRQLNINTAPLQAQAIQTSETPEDFQQEFGQIYSRTDFSGGSGLDKAHKRDAIAEVAHLNVVTLLFPKEISLFCSQAAL